MVYSFPQNNKVTGQRSYQRYFAPAYPGMFAGTGNAIVLPFTNTVGAQDTYTLAIPAIVDASKDYKVTVAGETVTFTTDADPTQAELGQGLYDAMRQNARFYRWVDAAYAANTITLTARGVGEKLAVSTNTADTTNDVVLTNTVSPSENGVIAFGRFVGRKAGYRLEQQDGVSQATLVDHATDYTEIFGVTVTTEYNERQGIGQEAVEGYRFGDTLNVLVDTGTTDGIWVECPDNSIQIGNTPYISVSAGQEGMLTNVATGNVAIGTRANIISGAVATIGGRYCAKVRWSRY